MAREDPQLKFRVPAELRSKLEGAAAENNRSLSAEIVQRLESSFRNEIPSLYPVATGADDFDPNIAGGYAAWAKRLANQYQRSPEPGEIDTGFNRPGTWWVDERGPDRGTDIVHIDENGLATLIQTKVSRALDDTLKTVTQNIEAKWLQRVLEIFTTEGPKTPREIAERVAELEANLEKQRVIAPEERKSTGSARFSEESRPSRRISRQRAKQMQQEAEDAPIFHQASPGIRAMWAKKAAARKRKRARKPSVASLIAGQGSVDSDNSYSTVQAAPKPAIASDAPAQSDPRAGTSLSTKPVKSRSGVRIERRYVRPGVGAYERFSQAARDAEASKAELEALQAKYPVTPNIAPLSAPNMEKLLRTGVRPAKVPEKVEKALTLRKAAAKESRIRDPNEPRAVRDPNEPRAVRDPNEPRPVKARKKAPRSDDAV